MIIYMTDLERSVAKFISEDGGGPGGRFESLETIEDIYDTLKLLDKEKPELEVFTKKVNEYLLFFQMEGVRKKRNKMLSECDWTQMNDVKLSNDAEWKLYRQALRDLPSSVDLEKPVYPLFKAKESVDEPEEWRGVEVEEKEPEVEEKEPEVEEKPVEEKLDDKE